MGIKLITDSACDIPPDLIDKYGIIVLPFTIKIGDVEYKDAVDITAEQLVNKMDTATERPVTSQVSPFSFIEAYKNELEKGSSIMSIHISSELSGTCQSALIAKQMLDDAPIAVIDSLHASLALGMIVLKAAQLIEKGLSLKQIVDYIDDYKRKVKSIIVVDSLEHLYRGGRLSDTMYFAGKIMDIKPIITIDNGKIVLLDKVRGQKKTLRKIIEYMRKNTINLDSEPLGIGDIGNTECKDALKKLIIEEFGQREFIEANVGCVMAYYAGPGTYGVVFV